MKKIFFTILLILFVMQNIAVAGSEIAVVQSVRVQPFEDALTGFNDVCHSGITRYVLSESKAADVLKQIDKTDPDMILAVGKDALVLVKAVSHIPIVYMMVLNPQSVIHNEKNIAGVSMNVPYDRQLETFKENIPQAHSIGLLYDPDRTGYFVKEARSAAKRKGVRLVAQEIYQSKDAPSLIMNMKGRIDAFWMLPDITVVTPETIEFLLLFSMENKIPILTFSEKYVKLGAFMSMNIDATDMGKQAGSIANKILSGYKADAVGQVFARKAALSINMMVANKLGIFKNIAWREGAKTNGNIISNSITFN